MEERRFGSSPKLRKEVLPPFKPQSGLGVMLVASAAMFFAVASSAFILRARMAQNCCPLMQQTTPVQVDWNSRPAPAVKPACGEAQARERADGTISVTFDTCAPGEGLTLDDVVIVNAPSALDSTEGAIQVHDVRR